MRTKILKLSHAMIRTQKPSFLYLCGLFLSAVGMLILPLIYLTLTLAVGWSVYYFATNHFLTIWNWPVGRSVYSTILRIVCSVTPLLVGGIVAIFMVKPLFTPRPKQMRPLALNPEIDQRVYVLVHEICKLLGAKPPVRIELDCSLNASAGFDGGLSGFFTNRLVLTLGMPLVAGLTQRELAGVIAHEFGHFRQGFGMRVSYLIRSVNQWFARVVYERDALDEALDSAAESSEGWMSLMIGCAKFGVWISRGVLWLLMKVGHAISAFLLRQMEYDADAAEIELAGSHAFETTELKIAILGAVWSDLHLEMRRSWRNHFKLPDNLPWLLAHRATNLPATRREHITNAFGLKKTGFFDTHPSSADRIQRARQSAQPGYEISEEPAADLFADFRTLSKMVTLIHYDDDLNIPTSEDFLIPVEKIMAEPAAKPADNETQV
jgi:Zn-dependent protease with chaperone function